MASKIKEWLSAESVSQTLKAAFDDKIQDIDLGVICRKDDNNYCAAVLNRIKYDTKVAHVAANE